MPKEIASRLLKPLAMKSQTLSFYYDTLQLVPGHFIYLGGYSMYVLLVLLTSKKRTPLVTKFFAISY